MEWRFHCCFCLTSSCSIAPRPMVTSKMVTTVSKLWDLCLCSTSERRVEIPRASSLVSKARELSRASGNLSSRKDDEAARIDRLVSEDVSKEPSSVATQWFDSVDEVLASSRRLEEQLSVATRQSTSKRFQLFGCRRDHELAREAGHLLRKMERVMGQAPTEERQLLREIPVMVVARRTLDEKALSLKMEMEVLRHLKERIERRVSSLLSQHRGKAERSSLLNHWSDEVELVSLSTSSAIERYSSRFPCSNEGDKTQASSPCSNEEACKACTSNLALWKEMVELLEKMENLRCVGSFSDEGELVVPASPARVEDIPIHFEVVGQQVEFDRALNLIEDDELGMVGIWGTGGIGKTTLLHRINNYFYGKCGSGFDVVIWVTVGRDGGEVRTTSSMGRIQKGIGDRLDLSLSETGEVREQGKQILEKLKSLNFLLLLDDVWDEIELRKLGIPPFLPATGRGGSTPQQHYRRRKTMITTRDERICHQMHVTPRGTIELKGLSPQESWELFRRCGNYEESVLRHPEMGPLVRDVARECEGVPLALRTVATAMATADEPRQWMSAISELRNPVEKLSSQLRFSFERLPDAAMREILFIVLAAFPAGAAAVQCYGLATLAVGQGLIRDFDTLTQKRDKAESLISHLIRSGLLMWSWEEEEREFVKLHDCVRDMLVQLVETGDERYVKEKAVRWSQRYPNRKQLCEFFRRWKQAKRISMLHYGLKEIPDYVEIPRCHELVHLSLFRCNLVRLPDLGFFDGMPSLRILNLTGTQIEELPSSIGALSHLALLNLSQTKLRSLPKEMCGLKKLLQLCLNHTRQLVDIPRDSIHRLYNLEMLQLWESSFIFQWAEEDCKSGNHPQLSLQDLEELTTQGRLRQIHLTLLCDSAIMQGLASSNLALARSITMLLLDFRGFHKSFKHTQAIARMENLETLRMTSILQSGFGYDPAPIHHHHYRNNVNLSLGFTKTTTTDDLLPMLGELIVFKCPGIRDLAWAKFIPSLRYLMVDSCDNLSALLTDERVSCHTTATTDGEVTPPFSRLKKLEISHCPSLTCIARWPLPFPCLEAVEVENCPVLKELPFTEHSAPRIRKIVCSEEWKNGLRWQSWTTKSRFLPYFVSKPSGRYVRIPLPTSF